jgi:AcrR family transcriptional regulator
MNGRLLGAVGRITGVSAAETRERLLRAGAAAFEEQGFEGTRVADIATGAGVSNGALYSHFASKTELLAEALRDHGPHDLAALFVDETERSVLDLLVAIGEALDQRSSESGGLVVEALVAARRDAEVATVTGEHLHERDGWLIDLIRQGQAEGTIDPSLSPEVVSRFCMMLRFGSILLPAAGLPALPHDDWRALIARLGDALRPPAASDSTTTAPVAEGVTP